MNQITAVKENIIKDSNQHIQESMEKFEISLKGKLESLSKLEKEKNENSIECTKKIEEERSNLIKDANFLIEKGNFCCSF